MNQNEVINLLLELYEKSLDKMTKDQRDLANSHVSWLTVRGLTALNIDDIKPELSDQEALVEVFNYISSSEVNDINFQLYGLATVIKASLFNKPESHETNDEGFRISIKELWNDFWMTKIIFAVLITWMIIAYNLFTKG